MTEQRWSDLEARLIDAHRAADPPLSPAVWRGVAEAIAAPPPRRHHRRGLALGALVFAAACAALLWSPPARRAGPDERSGAGVAVPRSAVEGSGSGERAPRVPRLDIVLPTSRPVTLALEVDGGRVELAPCHGRLVSVTVLDGPHAHIALHERDGRVTVSLDHGGAALRGGVATILVPADTHVVLSVRRGAVRARGLAGPIEIDGNAGVVELDTAPHRDPRVTVAMVSGAITWRGRCGPGCRIDARSRTGDVTLRADDRAAFDRGAARAQSESGRVQLEEMSCLEPSCLPLSGAPGSAAR